MPAHSRNRLNDCSIVRPVCIEDVTRYHYMLSAILTSDPAKRIDGVKTGFVQRRTHFGFEPPEWLAQLPVSRVYEFHEHPCLIEMLASLRI